MFLQILTLHINLPLFLKTLQYQFFSFLQLFHIKNFLVHQLFSVDQKVASKAFFFTGFYQVRNNQLWQCQNMLSAITPILMCHMFVFPSVQHQEDKPGHVWEWEPCVSLPLRGMYTEPVIWCCMNKTKFNWTASNKAQYFVKYSRKPFQLKVETNNIPGRKLCRLLTS